MKRRREERVGYEEVREERVRYEDVSSSNQL